MVASGTPVARVLVLAAGSLSVGGLLGATGPLRAGVEAEAGPAAATSIGPRALPTFVELEVDGFPFPAAEACAGERPIIDVVPPGSIADALIAATPSTTVRVAPGTYVESPTEPTALTWATDGLCLLAADGGEVVLQAAPGYGLDLRGDRAVLAGFTLTGFEAAIGLWARAGLRRRHRPELR